MKYTLDTNVYIGAFRNPVERAELAQFQFAYTPLLYLTSIVAHELRAGARASGASAALIRNILSPFEGRSRIVTPSHSEWMSAGAIRASLATRGRSAITASFLNDIIVAVVCRAHGLVLVTRNAADFAAIKNVLPQFRFVMPFPVDPP